MAALWAAAFLLAVAPRLEAFVAQEDPPTVLLRQEEPAGEQPAGEQPVREPIGEPQELGSRTSEPEPGSRSTEPAPGSSFTEPGEDFVQANAAYETGDHATAIGLYRRLLERGFGSGAVHYNLGNAYLRNGELGQAIAAYLRSRVLMPRDQDVEANLKFARTTTRDAIAPPSPSPTLRTLFFWHFTLSRGELIRVSVVINALLWAVLALRLWRRGSELLRWSAVVLLVLLLCSGGSLLARFSFPTRVAVVVPQEIDVHAGNSADSVVRFKLHAGTEVRVVARRADWLRIGLPDGEQGWIDSSHAEVVSF